MSWPQRRGCRVRGSYGPTPSDGDPRGCSQTHQSQHPLAARRDAGRLIQRMRLILHLMPCIAGPAVAHPLRCVDAAEQHVLEGDAIAMLQRKPTTGLEDVSTPYLRLRAPENRAGLLSWRAARSPVRQSLVRVRAVERGTKPTVDSVIRRGETVSRAAGEHAKRLHRLVVVVEGSPMPISTMLKRLSRSRLSGEHANLTGYFAAVRFRTSPILPVRQKPHSSRRPPASKCRTCLMACLE